MEPALDSPEYGWWKAFPFRSIIGAVLYLALNTRPDIAFAVGLLARLGNQPSYGACVYVACVCTCWLMSYLKNTAGEDIRHI